MKKYLVLITIISLLMLATAPGFAQVSVSGDYTIGETKINHLDGSKSSTDVEGGILGLGYTNNKYLINNDYIHLGQDATLLGNKKDIGLNDFRLGYRFAQTDSFNFDLLASYIGDTDGLFRGPAFGLGAEYFFTDKWSAYGRVGYSYMGVKAKEEWFPHDETDLLAWAVGVNYQISERWSGHAGYREYIFGGEKNNADWKVRFNLASIGLTYKFFSPAAAEPEATPAPTEAPKATPAPTEAPKATPAPTEAPKATPAPTEAPKATPAPTEAPKATPAPTEAPKATPAPTETPKATPAPTVKPEETVKERQAAINKFLQPIFFDFDSSKIRANQIPVLEANLKFLKENADLNILVGGHADQKGSSAYNQKLSQKRAENVKTWLVNNGIKAEKIRVAAYGEDNAYFHKVKDSKWESDRWVDIVVTSEVPTEEIGIRK